MLKIVRPDKQDKAKNLFVRLKLHESTSNLFGNPKFQEWMRSVEKSYKKTPEAADAAMVLTMTTQFGDDGLAKLLLLEKTSPTRRRWLHDWRACSSRIGLIASKQPPALLSCLNWTKTRVTS